MKVSQISGEVSRLSNVKPAQENSRKSFGDILSGQLEQIEKTQNKSDQMTEDLITGQSQDLHSVLAAAEEARITLEMALQVRNKAIDAYKELTNMQL